jgi:hypothetical protein
VPDRLSRASGRRASDAPRQVVGAPAEQLDPQPQGEAIRHPAHIADRERRGLRRTRVDRETLWLGEAARCIGKVVDQPLQETDHSLGLPASSRPEVDALEVELAECGKCTSGRLGHADMAGVIDGIEHCEHERSDLLRAASANDTAHLGRQIFRHKDAGTDRILEVVAHVRDAVGPRHDLTFGGGRRRTAPRVVANAVERLDAQVELGECDVSPVHRVVVARAGEIRREGTLGRMARRTVPAIVGKCDRLGERNVEVGGAGDAHRHLRDLDGMGEARAQMVVVGRDEHLALAGQATPWTRVLHPVEVALEAQAVGIGLLGSGPLPRTDRAGGAGSQGGGQLGLPLLPRAQAAADKGMGPSMGLLDDELGATSQEDRRAFHVHVPRVPVGCDSLSPVHETENDLAALQRMLDASHRSAGAHLRSIFVEERRLDAAGLVDLLRGVQILSLATVTADGRPLVGPVDGLFYRGHFYFGSSPESVRFHHIRTRGHVSAAHVRGEDLAVIVHGTAVEINTSGTSQVGFRNYLIEVYGDEWTEWGPDSPYARIDPAKMFAAWMPGTAT